MELNADSAYTITHKEFELLRELILRHSGIALADQKKTLVVARLSKRLRALDMADFTAYHDFVTRSTEGHEELIHLISRITTNKTDFYREVHHFEYLQQTVLPHIHTAGVENGERVLRMWSAGCSSGEEPYTLAMVVTEFFRDKPGWDIKILATDLDTEILETARAGVYSEQSVAPIPPALLRAHFRKGIGKNDGYYQIKDELKQLISFRRYNLIGEPFFPKRPFDIVFCRNVIIYFDHATKARVVESLRSVLRSGGHLFLGHSESLVGGKSGFRLVGTSTYKKTD